MKDDEYLWAKVSFLVVVITLAFVIIWCVTHPMSALDASRQEYSNDCRNNGLALSKGVPNVGSSNPKDWTCQK